MARKALALWGLACLACLSTSSALRIPEIRSKIQQPGVDYVPPAHPGHATLQASSSTASSAHQAAHQELDKPEHHFHHGLPVVSQGSDQVPGIELAARQALFNYGTQQGLEILKSQVQTLAIPDANKSFNLPIVGEFKLQLSNIHITQFNASSDEARLTIMDGKFELWVTQVEVQITFNWHWEKLGMSGTGSGELDLHGGNIDYRFHVSNSQDSRPQIQVEEVSSRFSSVDLQIKSFSADWLYQGVMSLFNDQIQKAVQNGIASALEHDVPDQLNKVLATLPTKLAIKGLPFATSFEYSIFTLTYVLVKGYGSVESDAPPAAPSLTTSHAVTAPSAVVETATENDPLDVEPEVLAFIAPQALIDAETDVQADPDDIEPELLASEPEVESVGGVTEPTLGPRSDASKEAVSESAGTKTGAAVVDQTPCPFAATSLPLDSETIGADSHMTSIYLHQSIVNCMLWGLYRGNALQYTLQDGTIPKLHLTTDLLAMLIPQLPKQYPHQFIKIEAAALAMPQVSFSAASGTTVQASYRTSIYVMNETDHNPKVATLSANLTINGQLNYDSTIITSASVHHTVEESSMPVSAAQWDGTVAWFIQNYAGLFPLQTLINSFVKTPVTSLVSLVNAASQTYDGWFTISGDVQVHPF